MLGAVESHPVSAPCDIISDCWNGYVSSVTVAFTVSSGVVTSKSQLFAQLG